MLLSNNLPVLELYQLPNFRTLAPAQRMSPSPFTYPSNQAAYTRRKSPFPKQQTPRNFYSRP